MKVWRDISIAKKLYCVIGTMAVLIACELGTLRFAMHNLSAVRAFVSGEGAWSKAQKDSAIALQRYALTRNEKDFTAFMEQLQVPEGDHEARIELAKPDFDPEIVRKGFLKGGIHPDDIDAMIDLLRRFSKVSYLAQAIRAWVEADQALGQFKEAGAQYHDLLKSGSADHAMLEAALDRVGALNSHLTTIEAEFSFVLGEGSRWMERVVISLLFLAVLMVESIGLTLTFVTTRALSRGLAEANSAATRIGAGDFKVSVPVRSGDELGTLAGSINQMKGLLESSYGELEARVAKRTSELEAMAKENARLYEDASSAVRMRDEFFSIASHELKTPLTGLNLHLQLLLRQIRLPAKGLTQEKIAEQLESCLRQTRRLAQLSSELMDLTKIRLGKLEITREPCDLAALARDAALLLGGEAANSGTALTVHAAEPVTGQFDAARLGQVFTNLISNAIKYGNSQPVSVDVRKKGSLALIEVRDHGSGIADAQQDKIFERFERGEDVDGKAAGLGLGLYITRQIVEKHGGRISLKSHPGEGSVFRVEIPA